LCCLDGCDRGGIMALADKLQEGAAKYLGEIVLAFVLSGLTAIGVFADQLLPPEVFEAIGTIATGRILLTLCLVLLALVAWVIYLHPRLAFDRESGAYVNPKSGVRYCTKCRAEKRLRVPMRDWPDGSGWQCPACQRFYYDSTHKRPTQPAKRAHGKNWVTRY